MAIFLSCFAIVWIVDLVFGILMRWPLTVVACFLVLNWLVPMHDTPVSPASDPTLWHAVAPATEVHSHLHTLIMCSIGAVIAFAIIWLQSLRRQHKAYEAALTAYHVDPSFTVRPATQPEHSWLANGRRAAGL